MSRQGIEGRQRVPAWRFASVLSIRRSVRQRAKPSVPQDFSFYTLFFAGRNRELPAHRTVTHFPIRANSACTNGCFPRFARDISPGLRRSWPDGDKPLCGFHLSFRIRLAENRTARAFDRRRGEPIRGGRLRKFLARSRRTGAGTGGIIRAVVVVRLPVRVPPVADNKMQRNELLQRNCGM